MVVSYFIVFICELIFSFLKTLLTKSTVKDEILKGSIYLGILQITWIVSTSLGVKLFLEHSMIYAILCYVISSILGFVLAIRCSKIYKI